MQETIELKLPVSGKTVKLRGYITGRIEQAIENVYLQDSKVSTEAEHDISKGQRRSRAEKIKQVSTMDATVGQKATNKAIELVVLEIDGNSEKIVDQVLDLPKPDYQAIVDKVNEITDPDPKGGNAS